MPHMRAGRSFSSADAAIQHLADQYGYRRDGPPETDDLGVTTHYLKGPYGESALVTDPGGPEVTAEWGLVEGRARKIARAQRASLGATIVRRPTSHEVALEVRRDGGAYDVPGAAEPEDWHAVRTELQPQEIEDRGPLMGWDPWLRVVRVIDADELERWYFLADDWPKG